MNSFKDLALDHRILQAIEEYGYTTPTPIQAQAIPAILKGEDVLGCAQTGTGKTAAFCIPMLDILSKKEVKSRKVIRGLILTPTRELAIQIGENLEAYSKHLPLNYTVIFGGVSQHKQVELLNQGVDILVATPGRLLDLIAQGHIKLYDVDFFVLDEADRMLDMGFINDVQKVLRIIPEERQNLFFSATMAPEILALAGRILLDPVKVEVAPVSSTAEKITQKVYFVDRTNKQKLLTDVLNGHSADQVLIFSKMKHACDRIAKALIKKGISADSLHGDKSQNARERALGNFKSKEIRCLVATDIAARGIDIEGMELVINFDLPNIPETYVHRIGRTGRAGRSGEAISFCEFEEKAYLTAIEKITNQEIPVDDDHDYPMEFFEVIKKEPRPARKKEGDKKEEKKKFKPTVDQKVASAKNKGRKTWFGKKNKF